MRSSRRAGGDALNGVVVAGHDFVANHGVYTEVSKATYDRSLWHVYSIIVTLPLAMCGMIYFMNKARAGIIVPHANNIPRQDRPAVGP